MENFVVFVQTQFKTTIKIIKSDNEFEFSMTNFFFNKGIVHQTSCVNTSQQNSIVGRKHGHILNVAKALTIQQNMFSTPILNYSSPCEMLYKSATNFNGLKVFKSSCYASTLSTNKRRFYLRASKCVFIGFKMGTKGYILQRIFYV